MALMKTGEVLRLAGAGLLLVLMAGGGYALQKTAPSHGGSEELPQPDADAVWRFLESVDYEQSWQLWPGTETLYEGTEPHGMLLTTYVNPTAHQALTDFTGTMPRGSIIVKENYTPQEELAAVTVMYKAEEGYNPDHSDWFWLKRLANGEVEVAGKAEGCQACHGVSQNDYLRTPLP